ncbi:hypothetical protein OG361_08115 [Streptomyces sp. NBC_00090]
MLDVLDGLDVLDMLDVSRIGRSRVVVSTSGRSAATCGDAQARAGTGA